MERVDSIATEVVLVMIAVIAIHVGPCRHVSAGSLGPFYPWLFIILVLNRPPD